MKFCAVKNCPRNEKKECENTIKFFSFPENEDTRRLWVKACGKRNLNTKTGRVCSLHFTDADWRLKDILLNNAISKRLLNPEAIPTQMLPDIDSPRTMERKKRFLKRSQKKIVEEAIKENDLISITLSEENPVPTEQNNLKSVEVQTEVQLECTRELQIFAMEKKMKIMKKEMDKMKLKITRLSNFKKSVRNIFTEGQLKKLENPKKKIHWSLGDISAATCLHSAGPRAYRYMYKRNYPLPGPSTLRHWATKIKINIFNKTKQKKIHICCI